MAKTTGAPRAPATGSAGVVLGEQGQPAYILLEYDLYLAHQAEIDAWRAEAAAGPSGRPQLAELVAEARRIRAEIERDPSRLISHDEIRRRIAEKQAAHVAT
jgi:hypothetical protein